MATPRFGRMITAMVTPFSADLELDLPRAQQLADRLISERTEALVVCGTTGESPTVFYPQKLELFRAVIQAVGGRVPVIANTGDNCTADSVEFTREVAALGVDGIMAVVPYYNKPPQEGLYRHFHAIAESVDLPVVLYNIPGRSVINMTAETILRLAHDVENIVALKEASGNLAQVAEIVAGAPDGFEVLSGNDEDTLPIMGLGGTGVISVVSHVAGPIFREMVEAQARGDHTRALRIHLELLPLVKALFMTSNPIMVKKALELVGFPVGGLRLPLIEATEAQTAELARIMRHTGILD
ncbi:MAG: 4-hydroxy-tetrahydrodipicolinate synthase [Coriobacteriia bacterium]